MKIENGLTSLQRGSYFFFSVMELKKAKPDEVLGSPYLKLLGFIFLFEYPDSLGFPFLLLWKHLSIDMEHFSSGKLHTRRSARL